MLFCFSTGAGAAWGSPTIDLPFIYPGYGDTAHFINDCTSLATDAVFADNNIKLWPNPTTGEVNISGIAGTEITIYNTMGEIKARINAQKDVETVDIAYLPPGIYILQVMNPITMQRHAHKLIKL